MKDKEQNCFPSPPQQIPSTVPQWLSLHRFGVLGDQGLRRNTVQSSRREGRQDKVFERVWFHCGKPVLDHVGFWLDWFPNIPQSTYLRFRQSKQKAAGAPGGNPAALRAGPAASFSYSCLFSERRCLWLFHRNQEHAEG